MQLMALLLQSLLFTLLVPGTVAVIIPLAIAGGTMSDIGWGILPGLLFLVPGFLIYGCCVWDFAVLGKGTPAPVAAPKQLVIRGMYCYTRNPMYLAVLSLILGWFFLFPSPELLGYWFFVALCFQLFVLFYEEPKLKQLFGTQYSKYQSSVNRWLPGIR